MNNQIRALALEIFGSLPIQQVAQLPGYNLDHIAGKVVMAAEAFQEAADEEKLPTSLIRVSIQGYCNRIAPDLVSLTPDVCKVRASMVFKSSREIELALQFRFPEKPKVEPPPVVKVEGGESGQGVAPGQEDPLAPGAGEAGGKAEGETTETTETTETAGRPGPGAGDPARVPLPEEIGTETLGLPPTVTELLMTHGLTNVKLIQEADSRGEVVAISGIGSVAHKKIIAACQAALNVQA